MIKKKTNKTKIIMIASISLAAVSIGAVGFASWIAGIEQNTDTGYASLTVDGVQNTSNIFTVIGHHDPSVVKNGDSDTTKETGTVTLAETHELVTGEMWSASGTTPKMTVSFDYKLQVGKDLTWATNGYSIDVTGMKAYTVSGSTESENSNVTYSKGKISAKSSSEGTAQNYISLSSTNMGTVTKYSSEPTSTLSEAATSGSWYKNGSFYEYYGVFTLTLTWGSFWNVNSSASTPCGYLNNHYSTQTNSTNNKDAVETFNEEEKIMNEFKSSLDGVKLEFTFTLIGKASA